MRAPRDVSTLRQASTLQVLHCILSLLRTREMYSTKVGGRKQSPLFLVSCMFDCLREYEKLSCWGLSFKRFQVCVMVVSRLFSTLHLSKPGKVRKARDLTVRVTECLNVYVVIALALLYSYACSLREIWSTKPNVIVRWCKSMCVFRVCTKPASMLEYQLNKPFPKDAYKSIHEWHFKLENTSCTHEHFEHLFS